MSCCASWVVTGRNVLWLDIAVFGLSIAAAQTIVVALFRGLDAGPLVVVISGLYLAGIVAAYLLFTLRPPRNPTSLWTPPPICTGSRGMR